MVKEEEGDEEIGTVGFRFSPCFFLYICTMIPPIWFMEINRINVKLGRVPINQTEGAELKSLIEQGLISKANLNDKTVCLTNERFFLFFVRFSPFSY